MLAHVNNFIVRVAGFPDKQLPNTITSYELRNLKPQTQYRVGLAAESSAGRGDFTELEIVTTEENAGKKHK